MFDFEVNFSRGGEFGNGYEGDLDSKGLVGRNHSFQRVDADLRRFLLVEEFKLKVERNLVSDWVRLYR